MGLLVLLVDYIYFFNTEKILNDNSYKLEDKTYKGATAQNKQIEDRLVLEAMDSPYTKLLMEHFLLSYLDLMDKKMFIQNMMNSKH